MTIEAGETILDVEESNPAPQPPGGKPGGENGAIPFLAPGEAAERQTRWNEIQAAFVDEPRTAVQQADGLVAETAQRLADSLARERQRLENEWAQGRDVSTETLRLTLRNYRSFFNRLVGI